MNFEEAPRTVESKNTRSFHIWRDIYVAFKFHDLDTQFLKIQSFPTLNSSTIFFDFQYLGYEFFNTLSIRIHWNLE